MGRILTCSVIMIVLLSFAIYGYNYSADITRKLIEKIDAVTTAAEEDDTEKATELAVYAENLWRDLSDRTIFVEDTECDNEIAMSLSRIKVLAENGGDELNAECEVLKRLTQLYFTRQELTWANII